MKDQALWDRIAAHPMPADFADRLAEVTGWPPERAAQTVMEYKRLAYLVALVKSVRRVPSRRVQLVWDLHRADSANYAQFTTGIMGRGWTPPRGGFARRDGRDALATRKAYVREFGQLPPARDWPDPNRVAKRSVAGGFVLAGAVGSLLAASPGPILAGGALALILLVFSGRGGGGEYDDDIALWSVISAADSGYDGDCGYHGDYDIDYDSDCGD